MKIAIVGSQEKYWDFKTRAKAIAEIKKILNSHATTLGRINSPVARRGGMVANLSEHGKQEITLISGCCPYGGVDIWVEILAEIMGFSIELYPPATRDRIGFRERNMLIAKNCDILYCIDPKGRSWSGGKWTKQMAVEQGKETHLVEIG